MSPALQRALAELVGTFVLVAVGCGAIVMDAHTGGAITHLGVSLAFGLVVMVVIYALGDVSGAHINPAVSLGFWVAGSLPRGELLRFLAAQCAGALLAALMLRAAFPEHPDLGATQPAIGVGAAFLVEVVISALLLTVIFHVVARGEETSAVSGIAIGATVAIAALCAGPLTGASMNPARSLGPALASGDFSNLWLYWTAPFVGALAALQGCRLMRGSACCR